MKTLTKDDLKALFEHPEGVSLRVSPQILAEFMDGYWVRPDGTRVRMTALHQWDDGELMPVFTVVAE